MDILSKKKYVISYLMNHDTLVSMDIVDLLSNETVLEKVYSSIQQNNPFSKIQDLLQQPLNLQTQQPSSERKFQTSQPSNISSANPSSDSSSLKHPEKEPMLEQNKIILVNNFNLISKKREVDHFVSYFSARYKQLEAILRKRKELANILSIARLQAKKDREQVSIIGLINSKEVTKNNNLILTVEDLTGSIKVLVNKTNKELFDFAHTLVEDEVIGIVGVNGDNILFSNLIIQPDVPMDKEFKKQEEDEYVVFLSDVHFGSKYFLKDEFSKFITWIRQETGTPKQKEIAGKVKYIFIAGDIVDGVGVYPSQENELEIFDIYEQYDQAAEFLKQIPSSIPIVICPGNHDALRLSEPQPKLSKDYARSLYKLDNITFVSNPALINIGSTKSFSGFDILLYHGYSFDHFIANVDSLRLGGGYDRADLIMKFLLKRRHLAPSFTSTLIIPEISNDALVIDKVPDFFVTGHIHKTAVSSYRNITLICGSCWQSTTSFQVKVGHHPEPARVPVVNLKTRKVTILNFEEKQEAKQSIEASSQSLTPEQAKA